VEKKVYLTFDDGPTPEITAWVLNQLKEFNAKATFFCIGENIQKYPEIYNSILVNGHAIGNHTFSHYNGLKTKTSDYIENVLLCKEVIQQPASGNQQLFRPPYGKLRRSQANMLRKKNYKIIMWDVLSADFDSQISPGKCLENVIKNVQKGSIIVFHDSAKAMDRLRIALPKVLLHFSNLGYQFKAV
jgi:peptidoglycan/xylan/chitin deacetylase (PgdA/CDA1 family)